MEVRPCKHSCVCCPKTYVCKPEECPTPNLKHSIIPDVKKYRYGGGFVCDNCIRKNPLRRKERNNNKTESTLCENVERMSI